jgi:hypothetical protein
MAVFSSDCWTLIRSLTSAEKAYVKRYGYKGQAREKAYWQLFDAMDRQDSYNEPVLRKRFAGGDGFRSFPAAKRHLQRRILAALMEYHSGKSPEDRLLQATREAWFLLGRGLDALASKRLEQAWKWADALEDPVFATPLYQIGGMLLPYTPEAYPERMALLDREARHAQILAKRTAYRILYARMTALVGKWGVIARDPKHVAEVDALLAEPLLQDDALSQGAESGSTPALDFMAQYLYYSIRKILHQIICRYPQSLESSRQLVALYDRYAERKEGQPEHYLMAVSNLLIDLVGLRKFEEFDATAEAMAEFLEQLPEGRVRREGEGSRLGRILYRQLIGRDFVHALETAQSLEAYDDAFSHQPHVSIQHRYLRAYAHACCGAFDAALGELVPLLQDASLPQHPDYHVFALVLNLMLHLELDHHSHLPYALERTRRVLRANGQGFAVEQHMLRFLKDREKAGADANAIREAFKTLRKRLYPLQEDAYERNAFHYFDFFLWIDAHLTGCTMMAVAQQSQ